MFAFFGLGLTELLVLGGLGAGAVVVALVLASGRKPDRPPGD